MSLPPSQTILRDHTRSVEAPGLSGPDLRLSGRALPLHYHRHCPHMSFTAVLGMNVLQHCLGGQRSRVSHASVKVLDALDVSAGATDEGWT